MVRKEWVSPIALYFAPQYICVNRNTHIRLLTCVNVHRMGVVNKIAR